MSEIQESKRGMAKEAENFKVVIKTIPSIPTPFEHSTLDSQILLPFVDRIAMVEMLKRSIPPTFNKFIGDSDPVEHIVEYHKKMSLFNLLSKTGEAITCNIFCGS